jgi:hypothetical protein
MAHTGLIPWSSSHFLCSFFLEQTIADSTLLTMRPSPVARHIQCIRRQFRLITEAATTGGSVHERRR